MSTLKPIMTRTRTKHLQEKPAPLEGQIGNRSYSYKATTSPEHVKHRAEQLAEMARDIAKEKDLEVLCAQRLARAKNGSASEPSTTPLRGSPAMAANTGSLQPSPQQSREVPLQEKLFGTADSNEPGSSSQGSNTEVLAAIAALTAKFDTLATKDAFQT